MELLLQKFTVRVCRLKSLTKKLHLLIEFQAVETARQELDEHLNSASVYVYGDYTLEIECNVTFDEFKTLVAECKNRG